MNNDGTPIEKASAEVETLLRRKLGFVPHFTIEEDGGGWAFWVHGDDTTSYIHRDLSIEWYGTNHEEELRREYQQ